MSFKTGCWTSSRDLQAYSYRDKRMNEADVPRWPAKWAREPFVYLTTIGRRTGRPHRIEIWFAVHDGRLYLMSGGRDNADWVRNLKANRHVSVEVRGEIHQGIASPVEPDSAEDQLARDLLVSKYRKSEDNLEDWGRTSLPVVIQFAQMQA
jgi:deazaflavin-dependent oxidoreductase (nitroreductase family)